MCIRDRKAIGSLCVMLLVWVAVLVCLDRRIGEARRPGPSGEQNEEAAPAEGVLRLDAVNVTSLRPRMRQLL
eukprot:8039120-Alexandrium_andersonii.AAC.1